MPTIVFCDSFDHYATADLAKKWTTVNNGASNVSVSSVAGRNSTAGLHINFSNSSAASVVKSVTAAATIYVEFALYSTSLPAADAAFLVLLDTSTVHVDLRLTSTGEIRATRNGTSLAVTS